MNYYLVYLTTYDLEVIINAFKENIEETEEKRVLDNLKFTLEKIKEVEKDSNGKTTT
jgi:hypothetical protein